MIAGEVPTRIGWDTYPRGPSHHTSPWHRKALNRSVCLRWGWRRRGLFSRAKCHTWAVRVTLGENYKRCGKPARFYPRKMIYKWWVRPHIYDSLQEGTSSLRTPQKRVPKKCLGNVRWQFPCKKDFDVLLQLKYHGSQTCVSRSPYHGDSKKLWKWIDNHPWWVSNPSLDHGIKIIPWSPSTRSTRQRWLRWLGGSPGSVGLSQKWITDMYMEVSWNGSTPNHPFQ